jgi:hypothetical protein
MRAAQHCCFPATLAAICLSLSASAGAAPPPPPADTSVNACAIRIHPNGSIEYKRETPYSNTFCLADDPNGTKWSTAPSTLRVSYRSSTADAVRWGNVVPNTAYSFPEEAAGKPDALTIIIEGKPMAAAPPDALDNLERLVESDKVLLAQVEAILTRERSDSDPLTLMQAPIHDLKRKAVDEWWPIFNGPLPYTGGGRSPVLLLDSTGNATRVDDDYKDGTRVRGWPYNFACASPQTTDFVKGSSVVTSNPLVPFLASLIEATAPKIPDSAFIRYVPPGIFGPGTKPASPMAENEIARVVTAAWRLHTPEVQPRRCTTALTATVLDGGFNYSLQAVTPASGDGTSKQPSKVTGAVAFKTHALHRIVSVAVELAYGRSVNGFPDSGYGYQPVAASGPDQLYQLQGLNHFQDRITSSALLVWYPIPTFTSDVTCGPHHMFCDDGLVLGFGTTFLRGGTAEFARQWDLRLGWEIVPSVLVLTGPSWRSIDVPSLPAASLNSMVSVPRPGGTPGLATQPGTDLLWSIGLAVDLGVVASGVSAVSKAVSGAGAKE